MNVRTAIAGIAAELGANWAHVTEKVGYRTCEILRRSDGLEIVVEVKRARFVLSQNRQTAAWTCPDVPGHRPPNGDYRSTPRITATVEKAAAKLARDIERRLLPDCERFHAKAMAALAAAREAHENTCVLTRVEMSELSMTDARRVRDMVSGAFNGRRKTNASVRDEDGRPALCSFPHFFRSPAGEIRLSCWQRHPTTGLYREVVLSQEKEWGERQMKTGAWSPRSTEATQ